MKNHHSNVQTQHVYCIPVNIIYQNFLATNTKYKHAYTAVGLFLITLTQRVKKKNFVQFCSCVFQHISAYFSIHAHTVMYTRGSFLEVESRRGSNIAQNSLTMTVFYNSYTTQVLPHITYHIFAVFRRWNWLTSSLSVRHFWVGLYFFCWKLI